MTGMEVAQRTLQLDIVNDPCILASPIMDVRFFESVTGQRYASDPVEVACEAYRRVGANLCAQLSLPTGPGGADVSPPDSHAQIAMSWYSPEDVRDAIEGLPDTSELSRGFDVESTRDDYARSIVELRDITGEDMLWLAGFGRADFLGGFSEWRYDNYLECLALYPEHMGSYYAYTGHEAYLFNLAVAEAIEKYDLARFVFGGEDLCSSVGPICSPSTLRQYYFPALQHAVEPLIDHGIGIVWHCSGNVLPILGDLTEAGVVGFHGFPEDGGLTLEEMTSARTAEGHKTTLWGSVSTSSTLPHGSVEDVKADVERCFDVASPGGGFVLAASDVIAQETPTENILALFEHGREYGRRILV